VVVATNTISLLSSKNEDIILYDDKGNKHYLHHQENGMYYTSSKRCIEIYFNLLFDSSTELHDDIYVMLDVLNDPEKIHYSVFSIPYLEKGGILLLLVKIEESNLLYLCPDACETEITFFTLTCVHNHICELLCSAAEPLEREHLRRLFDENYYDSWASIGVAYDDPKDKLSEL